MLGIIVGIIVVVLFLGVIGPLLITASVAVLGVPLILIGAYLGAYLDTVFGHKTTPRWSGWVPLGKVVKWVFVAFLLYIGVLAGLGRPSLW